MQNKGWLEGRWIRSFSSHLLSTHWVLSGTNTWLLPLANMQEKQTDLHPSLVEAECAVCWVGAPAEEKLTQNSSLEVSAPEAELPKAE